MADKKKQHYVPQFYLKNFSTDKKSVGQYYLPRKKITQTASISNIAQESWYYGKDAKVENKLCEFEGKWSNVVKTIIENLVLPTSETELCALEPVQSLFLW